MSDFSVTKTRLSEGVWEGVIKADPKFNGTPYLEATYLDQPLDTLKMDDAGGNSWTLRLPIPKNAIADGVQTILIRDKTTDETLEAISIVIGEALADDIRPEMDLLRAELDMLKRAFRRHCLETM